MLTTTLPAPASAFHPRSPLSRRGPVLKGEDGHGFNTRGWPIAKWDGYWLHRDEGNATNLYLFHENGDFAQMLGRAGQGPMEFQSINFEASIDG